MIKRLKLKVRKFCGVSLMFVEVTGGNGWGRLFALPPPSWIVLIVIRQTVVWDACCSFLSHASDLAWYRDSIVSWHTTHMRWLKEHTSNWVTGFLTGRTSGTSCFTLEATLFLACVIFSDTFFSLLLWCVHPSSNDSSSTWLPLCCCSHWRIRHRTATLDFLIQVSCCFFGSINK